MLKRTIRVLHLYALLCLVVFFFGLINQLTEFDIVYFVFTVLFSVMNVLIVLRSLFFLKAFLSYRKVKPMVNLWFGLIFLVLFFGLSKILNSARFMDYHYAYGYHPYSDVTYVLYFLMIFMITLTIILPNSFLPPSFHLNSENIKNLPRKQGFKVVITTIISYFLLLLVFYFYWKYQFHGCQVSTIIEQFYIHWLVVIPFIFSREWLKKEKITLKSSHLFIGVYSLNVGIVFLIYQLLRVVANELQHIKFEFYLNFSKYFEYSNMYHVSAILLSALFFFSIYFVLNSINKENWG